MDHIGSIRTLFPEDIPLWVTLDHESDGIVKSLISNITVFYDGFDRYMEAKIRQHEAFMATEVDTNICLGIIAFSRRYNRITFLGVFERYDRTAIGTYLLDFALGQLDKSKDIFATILNSSHERMRDEKELYERFGFIQSGTTIEAGVEALVMQSHPGKG